MTAATHPSTAIPGPRGLPGVGGRLSLLKLYGDPFGMLRRLYATYGPLVAGAEGDPSLVFAFGPELNHRLLSEPQVFLSGKVNLLRLPEGTVLGRLFQNNLPTMNGPQHRQQRRLMQPAFHKPQIRRYCADMAVLTGQMLDRWRSQPEFDLHAEMRQLTQRIAVKTLFGVYDEAELDRVGRLLRKLIDLTSSPFFLATRGPFWKAPGMPPRRAEHLSGQLEAYIRSVIARKRSEPLTGITPDGAASDMLAALVRARDEEDAQLTDDELVGHAFTMFVAGHETTSNALTWTLFLLDQHPRIAAGLLDELEGILDAGQPPSVEQLESLNLLDGVVRESLRLLPPAPIGVRTAAVACELGGYALPDGATIFYSEFITHRIPELYPEPNRFRPERWAELERTAYEYLPFGAGPHMCIGWAFAMQEVKLVLALLLPRYRLTLRPGSHIRTGLHMRPLGGMPARAVPQDHHFQASPVRGQIFDLVSREP